MSSHLLSVCAVALFSTAVCADDWNQWLGNQRDAVSRETGILLQFPPSGPPVRWRIRSALDTADRPWPMAVSL